MTFPTTGAEVAHAVIYPPTSPDHEGPAGERPPLLVLVHGGPTGSVRTQLQLAVAYWTSRGFAVADVDYRGSTGYGREYRHRLHGAWGILDVEDCVAVARHLADADRVDPDRLAIRGSSAGGFTVLAALTFHDVFTAGASRYGIGDLAALAADTHKFEARYLNRLVGRWPEDEAVYRERSPIHHVDRLSTPLLLLQGSEDAVVPPAQATPWPTLCVTEACRSPSSSSRTRATGSGRQPTWFELWRPSWPSSPTASGSNLPTTCRP